MKTLILSFGILFSSMTLSQAQSSDMPHNSDRAQKIDQQLEQFKESLDTLDIASLFEQFSLPLGDGESKPSDKTLGEIQQGMDEVVKLLDNIDVQGMESLMAEFMENIQSMMGDLDLPNKPKSIPKSEPGEPTKKSDKEIKKI